MPHPSKAAPMPLWSNFSPISCASAAPRSKSPPALTAATSSFSSATTVQRKSPLRSPLLSQRNGERSFPRKTKGRGVSPGPVLSCLSLPRLLPASTRRRPLRWLLRRDFHWLLGLLPVLCHALLQRLHQVDHRSHLLLRLLLRRRSLALLALDQLLHAALVLVLQLLRLELRRQLLHELLGQLDLRLLHFHFRLIIELRHRANLFRIVERVQHQSLIIRPDHHDLLPLVQRDFRNRPHLQVLHAPMDQRVRLPPRILRHAEIGRLVVQRIYIWQLHELLDLHRLRRLRLQRLQLLAGHANVVVFADLVSLHDLIAVDVALAVGAVELLPDARPAYVVQLVERDVMFARRHVQPDRHRDQTERDVTLPDGRSHRALRISQEKPAEKEKKR